MSFKNIFILSVVLVSVLAQSGGNGVSKSTWASAEPHTCLAWFLKYIPNTITSDDSCPDS